MTRTGKLFIAVISTLLMAIGAPAAVQGASTPDEQWRVYSTNWQTLVGQHFHSISIIDQLPIMDTFSHLWAEDIRPQDWSRHSCVNSSEPKCANFPQYSYESILPVCKNSTDFDCVDSLSSIDSSGVKTDASFKQYNVDKHPNNFIAAPELNIPQNSNPSIWDLPTAPHSNGTSYLVDVGLKGSVDNHGSPTIAPTIFANIVPVSIHKNALMGLPSCWPFANPHNDFSCTGSEGQYNSDTEPRCAAAAGTSGDCYAPEAFPAGLKFSLKIRLKQEPLGWIHGRISSPAISIDKDGSGITVMTVSADPVIVPVFYTDGPWAALSPTVKKWWNEDFARYITTSSDGAGTASGSNPENPSQNTENNVVYMSVHPYGDFSMMTIKTLSAEVKDTSVAAPSTWSFHSLDNFGNGQVNSCITNGSGLKGIVTTNSTAYSQGAPTFDNGNLNYKVASLHYLKDGSVFHGTYDLILRSDVARCLYKFSNAPISATISVLSEDGTSQVTSTSVNEKAGWLYLSANGFTFSSPTVKIKLIQEAPAPTASPSPSASPTVASSALSSTTATAAPATKSASKATITCIKGKTIKSVTAVKPTCPTGYKKK